MNVLILFFSCHCHASTLGNKSTTVKGSAATVHLLHVEPEAKVKVKAEPQMQLSHFITGEQLENIVFKHMLFSIHMSNMDVCYESCWSVWSVWPVGWPVSLCLS